MKRDIQRDTEGWITEWDGVEVRRISSIPFAQNLPPMSCINLKGCNGSGKSTIPMWFIRDNPYVYLTLSPADKKPVATLLPLINLVILGTYVTACGGCDSLSDTQVVKELLKQLWKRKCHIMYEGVIVGDIKSTFYDLMVAFRGVYDRNISFCFMGTKFSECLRRIQVRNGGKPIKEDLVKSKYKNSITHLKYYLSQGNVECRVLDTAGSVSEVAQRFLELYPVLRWF